MKKRSTINAFIEQEQAQGKKANRLIHEKSPYLLQHAFNPVHWYAWGEDAFARARSEGKPIFLSIGYSTCHWCHVMARESFENEEIAELLNKYFICIKVDREERPDVDQLYMAAVQALTGHGGWPMSVFLTPDLKPFYGGTYFPPEAKHGLPSFQQVIEGVYDAWQTRQDKVLASADSITAHIKKGSGGAGQGKVDPAVLAKAFGEIQTEYDTRYGGFGEAPKFPRPVVFQFLMRYHQRFAEEQALNMTLLTLRNMAAGGMYDHIGGGFHRYSVDARWRVPHFEKMLYDQAQLAVSYLEAFQVGQDPFYASVAQDVLDYVLRDMTSTEGGFFSAEDADSTDPDDEQKHGEGLFYLWSRQEIMELLGQVPGEIFCYHYGVNENGNALEDPHGEFAGKNILYIAHPLEDTARRFGKPDEELARILERSRHKLFEARSRRPHPHVDDKIITSWNGLMISALARAAQALGVERYRLAAEMAAGLIMDRLYDKEQRILLRRYREGEAGLAGQLDDYAFMVSGLIDLYEATFDIRWLRFALELMESQIRLFADPAGGGFFETPGGDASMLVRMKSDYDGAEPTGNSISAMNLLRLAAITGNDAWQEMGRKTIEAFSGRLNSYPLILPQMLVAHDFAGGKPLQLVVAGNPEKADTQIMLSMIRKRFLPNKIMLLADGKQGQEFLAQQQPFLAEIRMQNNRATAYVCENYTCKQPITDLAELIEVLDAAAGAQ